MCRSLHSALELQRFVDEKGQEDFEAASITSGALLLPLDTVTALVAPAQEQSIASGVALQGLGKSLAGMSGALSAIPVIGKVVQTFVKKTARRTLEPAGEKLRNNGIRIGKLEKNLEKTGSKVSTIDGLFLASAGVLVSVAAFFYSAGDILVKAHMCAFELGEEQVVAELEATTEAMRNGSQALIRHLNNIPSNVTNPFGDLKLRLDILSVKLPNLLSEFTKINLALQPFMWLTKFMDFRMCFYFLFFEKCFTVGHMLNILGKLFGVLSFLVNPIADLFAGLFPDISLPLPSLLDSWLLDLDKIMLDIDIAYNTLLPAMQFPFDFTDLMLPDILAKLPDNLPCNPFDDDAEIEAEESLEDEPEEDGEGRRLARKTWKPKELWLSPPINRRLKHVILSNSPRRRANVAVSVSKRLRVPFSIRGRKVQLSHDSDSQQAYNHNLIAKVFAPVIRFADEMPRPKRLNPAADKPDIFAWFANVGQTNVEIVRGRQKKHSALLPMNKLLHLEVFFFRRANRKSGQDLQPSPFMCLVDFDKDGFPSRSGEVSLELDGDRNFYSDPDFIFIPFASLEFRVARYQKLSNQKLCRLCPRKSRCVENPYKGIIVSGEAEASTDFERLSFNKDKRIEECRDNKKKDNFCKSAGGGGISEFITKAREMFEERKPQWDEIKEVLEKIAKTSAKPPDKQEDRDWLIGNLAGMVGFWRRTWLEGPLLGQFDKEEFRKRASEKIINGEKITFADLGLPDKLPKEPKWVLKSEALGYGVGEFAEFAPFMLFPPEKVDVRAQNLHRKKFFRWETNGLCALNSVYGTFFGLSVEELQNLQEDDKTNLVKVLQLLCEDEFAREVFWRPDKVEIERGSTKESSQSGKTISAAFYKKYELDANNLAKNRFGAFMNGFVAHQTGELNGKKVLLYFPFLPKNDQDEEKLSHALKSAPKCVDVYAEGSRFEYMSPSECKQSCAITERTVKTRLCAGGELVREHREVFSKDCMLTRCYTPEGSAKRDESYFYSDGKHTYWKKSVGKIPTGALASNKGGKFDNVDKSLTDNQQYHVEHMKDHSMGGRNAFGNFVMTWALPNLMLKNSEKKRNKSAGSLVLPQWGSIYGKLLNMRDEVELFCNKHVTTEERSISVQTGKRKKDGTVVEKTFTHHIIPRDKNEEEELTLDHGQFGKRPKLNVSGVIGNLVDNKGWEEIQDLIEETCKESILNDNYIIP